MSSLSATQSDGYYLPPEYFESGAYRKQSKNQFAAAQASGNKGGDGRKQKVGHNQWLKNGVIRFELPEKAICLGCRQSVGRGTRYNAKKITTDQTYFSTKIYEFRMTCRNCQHPWVIRTNPKDRGFAYISGVKRQAGQERNLITGSSDALEQNATTVQPHGLSLDDLEEAAVSNGGKKRILTEFEELERIKELNDVSASVNDAATNASIRKSFRKDRKEKRRRLGEAAEKGWRQGMFLLPSNEHDILAANEASYGQPIVQEKRRLSAVRKSSIFSCGEKKKRKHRPSSRRSHDSVVKIEPTPVGSGGNSVSHGIVSDMKSREATTPTSIRPVLDMIDSSSSLSTNGREAGTMKKKKTLTLRAGESGIFILGKREEIPVKKEMNASDVKNIIASSSSHVAREESSSLNKPPPSFLEMMAAYDSDDGS